MTTQYVNIKPTTKIDYALNLLAENYVLYASSIGVQYVFEEMVDLDLFKQALQQFLEEFPALSGVANFKTWQVERSEKGVPIEIQDNYPGHATNHATIGKTQRKRWEFVNEPTRSSVENGKGNLFAIKITNFQEGGCIVGLTMNHALSDATGHHLIAHRFSDFVQAVQSGKAVSGTPLRPLLDDFQFGTKRTKKETLAALKTSNTKKPLKVKGFPWMFVKKMITYTLDGAKRKNREIIHYSAEHIDRLKEKVKEESGLHWVSTNLAVGAHICAVMSKIQFGKKPAKQVQISNLFNMRNRYFNPEDEQQKRYCGNAMYIHNILHDFPEGIQFAGRGAIAKKVKASFDAVSAESVKAGMDLVVDCLRYDYTYPGLDAMKPIMGINNQSKIPAYGVDFGAGKLLRVIPQDVGDHILMFGDGNGGMEVYLRDVFKAKNTQRILEKEWQEEFYTL